MATRRRARTNFLLTALVIGRAPLRNRLRNALLLRSRRLAMMTVGWRVVRRIMVGPATRVRVVKTRSATVETE